MRRFIPSVVILTCLFWYRAAAVSAQQIYHAYVGLSVPLIGQEASLWCWAASGQMVMQYFTVSIRQCSQAGVYFRRECCSQPTPHECTEKGGKVIINHYGFTYTPPSEIIRLSESQIATQVYSRREPWIINPYRRNPQWGHVLVAVGYDSFEDIERGGLLIGINDPWPKNSPYNSLGQPTGPTAGEFYLETYEAYANGWYEGVTHTEGWDIYDIEPPPASASVTRPILAKPTVSPTPVPPELVKRVFQGDSIPEQAAITALLMMKKLMIPETVSAFGFSSEQSVADAQLGAPIVQFGISLERLRIWRPGERPSEMLERVPALFVPVQVDGRTRASLRLQQVNGAWKMATFGSARLSQAWQIAQNSPEQFLVEIEGLELAFAGRKKDAVLYLTPLFSDPELGLEAGREQRAEQIFPRLVDAAVRYRPAVVGPNPQ